MENVMDLDSIVPGELIRLADKLESGDIPKGQGKLVKIADDGETILGACCLGVYTLMVKDELNLDQEVTTDEGYCLSFSDENPDGSTEAYLLPSVQAKMGVTAENPSLPFVDGNGLYWKHAGEANDDGSQRGVRHHPELDFTVIAAAFRRLAKMATDYQEERITLDGDQPVGSDDYLPVTYE